jgi:hypothetical protein
MTLTVNPNPSAAQALLAVLEDATILLELLSRPEVPADEYPRDGGFQALALRLDTAVQLVP